ncbi:hypothetical protein D4Q76_02650 [archaeon]|nr:MAG: hypothetical protein D4Q76_02650 [archaeon]
MAADLAGWFGFKEDDKREKSDINLLTIDCAKLERVYDNGNKRMIINCDFYVIIQIFAKNI